jgi:signal transduction histidine kinase/ActR/RegA family two-component response regulator
MRWVHLVKNRRHRHDQSDRILRQTLWFSAVHGTAWGLAGVWLLPADDLVTSAIIASALIGAAAVCTFTFQAHMGSSIAMNIPMLVPAALMLLTRMDRFGVFGAAGLTFLCVTLLIEGMRAERRIIELLWLRFTTDRIAQERAEALKLAKQHSDVKDQFLATMSHEIRTPLNGMLGLAQLIEERLPARPGILGETRQQAALIRQSGKHLLSLINAVLDYSKLELGQLVIESTPFDLRALLNEVVSLSRVNAASKSLPLYAVLHLPDPCWVEGDAARVRQVLFNLLGNAIKFTDAGQVTLRVKRCDCGHEPVPTADNPEPLCARKVNFTIEDTGVGVEAGQIDRMFEAFTQLESTFSRRMEGTGLGLTISRELARAMQGDVVCTSRPGQGSSFTFSALLPTCIHRPERVADAPVIPASNRLHGHVLVVEDNPVNALVVQTHLDNQGLQVTLASDGQEALALLQKPDHGFDLVLMDCQMPVMDGLEATRRLRAYEHEHQRIPVPIIALTANVSPDDITRCRATGMNGHLAKPFELQDLSQLLKTYLQPNAITA